MTRPRWAAHVGVALLAFAAGVVATVVLQRPAGGLPAPGPIDIGFAQHMALHHDQAVAMSQLVRGRASPTINQLADAIASSQTQEIGQMKGWLALWKQATVPTDRAMAWMVPKPQSSSYDPAYAEACRVAPGGMPGLATTDELDALRRASGPTLDTLYLALMVRHHEGGEPMLRYAAEHAETDTVRQLAGHMGYEQRRETMQLVSLLHSLGRK